MIRKSLISIICLSFFLSLPIYAQQRSDTLMISKQKLDSLIAFVNKETQRFVEIEKDAQDTQKHLRGVLNALLIIKSDTSIHIRKSK